MKELKYYLSEAQEYEEGHDAVERLITFYTSDPKKAESLWQDAIDAYRNEGLLDDFENALEKSGLYVQCDNFRNKLGYFIFTPENKKETSFLFRMYSGGCSPFGPVAVLKLVIPQFQTFH